MKITKDILKKMEKAKLILFQKPKDNGNELIIWDRGYKSGICDFIKLFSELIEEECEHEFEVVDSKMKLGMYRIYKRCIKCGDTSWFDEEKQKTLLAPALVMMRSSCGQTWYEKSVKFYTKKESLVQKAAAKKRGEVKSFIWPAPQMNDGYYEI